MHTLRRLTDLVKAAYKAYHSNAGRALTQEFVSEDRHALTLLLAMRKAYGPEVVNWEPESCWLSHDFSAMNRDKLLAAFTLSTNPTMFIEPRGLSAIAHALSALPPPIDELALTPPHALAWAGLEGELIWTLANEVSGDPVYGPDVTEYVALCLANDGFVVAPESLQFADDRLAAHLSDEGNALRAKVQKEWKDLPNSALEEHEFPESAVGVQLARLAAVHVYCVKQAESLIKELTA